jgi:hypothetical protein
VHWLATALVRQGRPDIPPTREAIATFLADFMRPAAYDYLDVNDLRPAFVAARAALTQWVMHGPTRLRAFRGASR